MIKLFVANILQLFPFCLVVIHGVFLRSGPSDEYHWAVVLAMGFYSCFQIGGVWFIGFVKEELKSNPVTWDIFRFVGGGFFMIDHPVAIICGGGLLGLSSALFYKYVRIFISKEWSREAGSKFTYLALSLNLSYFLLPPLSIWLHNYFNTGLVMSIALFFSLFSGRFVKQLVGGRVLVTSNVSDDSNSGVEQVSVTVKNAIIDVCFLGSFIVPYGIMMALIPLKAKVQGYGIEANSFFFSINSVFAIITLVVKAKDIRFIRNSLNKSSVLFALSSLSWLLVVFSVFIPIDYFPITLACWSIVEAVQLPILETHVFHHRKYDSRWIDRILVFDSLGSLVAPVLAALLLTFTT